jgi:hypothetical protein
LKNQSATDDIATIDAADAGTVPSTAMIAMAAKNVFSILYKFSFHAAS